MSLRQIEPRYDGMGIVLAIFVLVLIVALAPWGW